MICFVVPMLAADMGYVYVVLNSQSQSRLIVVFQIALSVSRSMWNVFMWFTVKLAKSNDPNGISRGDAFLLATINLVNNVIIPCFAISLVSENCFYNVFYALPSLSVTESTPVDNSCLNIPQDSFYVGLSITTQVCVAVENTHTITSQSPFTYSYMCSSEIIVTYISVFAIMFLQIAYMPIIKAFLRYYFPENKTNHMMHFILRDGAVTGGSPR